MQANLAMCFNKEKGYGLSLLILSLAGISFAAIHLGLFSQDIRYRKATSYHLYERVQAISYVAEVIYLNECLSGEIPSVMLREYAKSEIDNMKSFGVDSFRVEVLTSPRPHVQIDLALFESDPVVINSLIINNADVSADGLEVTIKKPFLFSDTSLGSFFHRERELNSTSIICP